VCETEIITIRPLNLLCYCPRHLTIALRSQTHERNHPIRQTSKGNATSFLSSLRTKKVQQSPTLGSPSSRLWRRFCFGLPNALLPGHHLWFRLLDLDSGLGGFLRFLALGLGLGLWLFLLLFLNRLVRRVVFRLWNTVSSNILVRQRKMTYAYTLSHPSSSDF
jgi:hypothetical protein